jgi:hypothetical protein
VAGIAAYVSYWHAYEAVRAHGESGVTARLEPATIDGLVYASSMVVLYAARHQLVAPALARWLLAMGIVATLAANVAHGWPNGPIGAAVVAWPAASLVGSYELLLWLVRTAATAATACEPVADQEGGPADHLVRELRLVPMPDAVGAEHDGARGNHVMPGGHKDRCVVPAGAADRTGGPDWARLDQASRSANQETTDWPMAGGANSAGESIDAAAVAAYRTSIDTGRPLSERKLLACLGELMPSCLGEQPARSCLDLSLGDTGCMQLPLQVLPVLRGPLRHVP